MLSASKAAATVDNVEAQAILILSGAYVGFLPNHYAARWVETGDMRRISAERLGGQWPFCAITRRGVSMPSILKAFMADLQGCQEVLRSALPGNPSR